MVLRAMFKACQKKVREPSPRIELGPPPYQDGAMPLCYEGVIAVSSCTGTTAVRAEGFEPSLDWV